MAVAVALAEAEDLAPAGPVAEALLPATDLEIVNLRALTARVGKV